MLVGPGFGLLLITAELLPLELVPSRLNDLQGGHIRCSLRVQS